MISPTDRIEKKTFLRAPQERVWEAISDARRFGSWFGIAFDGGFVAGTRIVGKLTPTKADASYAGMLLEFHIDDIEPMRRLSYRWHPFAVEPDVDYSDEPMTRVTFELDQVAGGTMLTVTESGFDGIPLARRVDAFEANEEGWTTQVQLLEAYLALPDA